MKKMMGRLAFRHEGNMWNAYYALPDTMDGALLLGSIAMAGVESAWRKQAFMDLMRSFVQDIYLEKIGAEVDWKAPETAPEHERSGHS